MTTSAHEGSLEAPVTMEHLIELTRSVREIRDEARERQREVAAQMQETDRRMQETDRRMQETDRRMQETDRRLRRAENLFTTQWGKLMESLVEGDLVRLLQVRGVSVEGTLQRSRKRRNGQHFEIDILATNGAEVVAVEVKTTLRPEGVGRFVEKLSRFLDGTRSIGGEPCTERSATSMAATTSLRTPSVRVCSSSAPRARAPAS